MLLCQPCPAQGLQAHLTCRSTLPTHSSLGAHSAAVWAAPTDITVPGCSSPWPPAASRRSLQPHGELRCWTTWPNPKIFYFPVAGIQLTSFRVPAPLCGHQSDGTSARGKVAVGWEKGVKLLILLQARFSLPVQLSLHAACLSWSMRVWLNIKLHFS